MMVHNYNDDEMNVIINDNVYVFDDYDNLTIIIIIEGTSRSL